MAAGTAGALKAFLESQGLGMSAYHRRAPENQVRPYITIEDALSVVPELSGDFGSNNPRTVVELVTVHVWRNWRIPGTKTTVGDYTTVPKALRALDGANLDAYAPTKVYGVRVVGDTELPELDNNILHEAITVEIHRVL